jgi:hypothetical protein
MLAGAALLAGATGTVLFALLGLAAMLPLLVRMRRRSGGWRAPATALAVFAAMFALSTLVIGPAVRAALDRQPTTDQHTRHHR